MPCVRRILETSLYSEDVDRTAAFYERLLDTAPMLRTDRLTALPVGDGSVLLIFREGHSVEAQTSTGGIVPGHDGAGAVHIAFAIDSDEVAAWETRLRELGIDVESRVDWPRGGRSLYFRDPDGRSVELATPGLWPTY